MKKILTVLIVSMALVSCGNGEDNNEVIIVPESSTTTTTTMVEESTTTTSMVEADPPISPAEEEQEAGTPTPPKPVEKKAQSGSQGRISVPGIGLDWPFYEGIALSVLNKGPGHYPHSPLPCRAGNAAIAGHRTTYGAPFNKLDLLKAGDIINISTPKGDCSYKYLRTEIVSPNNVAVVMPKDNNANLLTLTACHPKGSARQRITVTAELVSVTLK